MASTSSINSSANVPNPPPRTHSRPTQPPPPPPLPSVPPVPPARDSSITISTTAISKYPSNSTKQPIEPALQGATSNCTTNGVGFLSQFESLFKPIEELPPPEVSMRSRNHPSQNFQKK